MDGPWGAWAADWPIRYGIVMAKRKAREGEVGIQYGGRKYLRTDGQTLIAQKDAWHLVIVPSWCKDGWLSFKLYLDSKATKNMFQVGVSVNGPARNKSTAMLKKDHPEILEWVVHQADLYRRGMLSHLPEAGQVIIYKKGRWTYGAKAKNKG